MEVEAKIWDIDEFRQERHDKEGELGKPEDMGSG